MAGNILGSLLLNIVTKSDDSGLRKTDRSLRKIGTTAKTVAKNTSLLGSLSKKFMGGFNISNIGNLFNSYLQFERNLGAIQSRFYAITKDVNLANKEFEFTRKISKEVAMSITDVADSYSIFFASASRALGVDSAKEVYENWTKVARVLHVSGEQYKSIMYAQREMSSKGQLYAQDLLIQMGTHVPDIRDIAQTAIRNLNISGVKSIKDFQEYTKSSPSTDIMGKFMLEMSREAKRRFASDEALRNALKQPDALMERIKIIGQDFLINFSKKGGTVLVVKILESIVTFLSNINYDEITTALGGTFKTMGKVADILTENMPLVVSLLTIIAKAVGLFYVIKGFRFLKNAFFAFKQGKLLPWLALKAGFGRTAEGIIKKGFLATFKQVGLKTILGKLLGLLGGPIVAGLTFLPDIWNIIKWIANHGPWKPKNLIDRFGLLGLTPEQAQSIITAVKSKGVTSQEDLDRKLMWYKGGEKLVGQLTYHDDSEINITMNIGDENVDATKIADATVDRIKKEKNKHSQFNKPFNKKATLETVYGR